MENICQRYLLELQKVKETAALLESELDGLKLKLRANPIHSGYLKDLKRVSLDMTITLNELEHCQSKLDECYAVQRKAEEKYND